ncbi:MAG: DUF2203 domain-containing protein [Thaumarchaeota archaeon]|nr:MAG: hypothetical protein NPMRIOTA_170020 [Nitrosopumilales archaeon]MCZ6582465.1 DUF2203 domain-containing protein [Nitrososphaerota archaeon]GFN39735.1 MAG: conserved hypothetical protein [Marine Group I thaumarchaeote]
MFSYFTIKDANKILPNTIKKFQEIVDMKKTIEKIQSEMEMSLHPSSDFKDYVLQKQKLNSAVSKLYKVIEELENTGVIIKSVDDGLLDFPSRRFNEDIWLCWKEGETEIKFWHEKNEGFGGRKPISVSDESLV